MKNKTKKPVLTLKKLSTERPLPASCKEVIPTVFVEGRDIKRYVEAAAKAKEAKADQDEVKPAVLDLGIPEIMERNCGHPDAPQTSVRLIDEADGEVVVSFQDRYQAVNPEAAIQALVAAGVQDVNDYLQEEMVVKFDAKQFHTADGKFNAELFVAVREALAGVAKKYGVAGELIEKEKVVKPNANFHARRWHDFTPEQNEALSEVLPNTVQVSVR